jgi:RNA polymerase sigma-70 factor, ECF subfamily
MKRIRNDLHLDGVSDEELVRRANAAPGSGESNRCSGELMLRHQDRLYHWCYRSVRDHERAMDLVQDVMLLAHRALPGFEGRAKFSSWLFMIARNRCLREVRRPGLLRDEEADPDEQPAATAGPETHFEQRESEALLIEIAREHLEPREREALWLRCFEGVSVDEITEMLNIREPSGARAILQSARRKLRAAIERHRRREERAT